MKSMKTNGQVLSEKEMKEVKGGYSWESKVIPAICPVCEHGEFYLGQVQDNGERKILCLNCGAIVDINQ